MGIVAKKKVKKQYPQSADGIHAAVLVDVEDLGERSTQWGTKHKVRLCFMTEELDPEGQPIFVSDFPVLSLDERARLHAIVTALTGVAPEDDVDLDTLIGRRCQLNIKQSTGADGLVYANVRQVLPPNPRDPILAVPIDFVRAKDRKKSKPNGKAVVAQKLTTNVHGLDVADRDIPF